MPPPLSRTISSRTGSVANPHGLKFGESTIMQSADVVRRVQTWIRINELAASEAGGAWGRLEHRSPRKTGPVGCWAGCGGEVVAGRTSAPRLALAAEAPDVTGCRGISCSEHFLGQLAVVRAPPPPSGVGATGRHHRASPQGAELTARDITFSGLRRRAGRHSDSNGPPSQHPPPHNQ